MEKVKVYCDSGADISKMGDISGQCEFYQFPYDSPHRPKKPFFLAKPSMAQWNDCHVAWEEFSEVRRDDFVGSPLHPKIEAIIGTENRRDVLHFDSAYKSGCSVFLTSDKGDIWSKKKDLETLTGIKTFCTPFERGALLEYFNLQRK